MTTFGSRNRLTGRYIAVLAMLACAVIVTQPALGQSGLATVKGTVLDASGASVPGATIALNNQNTGAVHSAESSELGLFEFPPVPLGTYRLTVQAEGFKQYSGNFTLQRPWTRV